MDMKKATYEPFYVHIFNKKKWKEKEFAQFLGKVIALIIVMNRNKIPNETYILWLVIANKTNPSTHPSTHPS